MFSEIIRQLKIGCLLLISMTLLTGVLYPLGITALAQYFFPIKANGSLIQQAGKKIGSELIGQSFSAADYFWGRPSATPLFPYNATNSAGSNQSPSNPDFLSAVAMRTATFQNMIANDSLVPINLVTASGSGLDPEISPAAALYQVPRVAKARGISEEALRDLIQQHVIERALGIFGEPRVNVVLLNLSLNDLGK
jgi:K+-transporting ATPase ATPase C chain